MRKLTFDTQLPEFSVWAIDCDAVCMEMGDVSYRDLTDREAIIGLRKLRRRLWSRLEAVERELGRLEARNEPTGHPIDEHRVLMANVDRYFREQYPRELEIALAEAGIDAK